jgi:UDP:flavonoid glycosyltransferase YjiC (YdhE family)
MLPLGRDQHFNATRVAELGAGIRLSADATAGRVAAAVTTLLSDPSYASTAMRLAKRIADDDAERRAAHTLEHTAMPGTRRDEFPAPHRPTPKTNR